MEAERSARVYQHDPRILSRQISGEMLLVPILKKIGDAEDILTLNTTGARIWELIDGRRSLLEVHRQMVDEFEVDPPQAEIDLLELVDSLEKSGALRRIAN